MATPSFQCLPRWLPPLPCSDMKEPPHVTGGARPREPGVYCPSSQGCPGEIFFLAKSNEDGKRVSPGGLVATLCQTLATPWTVACKAPLFCGEQDLP